eukprot:8773465-Pyramimonas_sp.AAC.1
MRFLHPRQRYVAPSGGPPKTLVAALAFGSPTRVVAPSGAPPKATVAALACSSPAQTSVPWLCRGLHRRPHWLRSHAVPPPRAALRGPVGSSTEGPSGCTRMRLRFSGQRFVASSGAPPKVPVAALACGSPTRDSVSWPHAEFLTHPTAPQSKVSL